MEGTLDTPVGPLLISVSLEEFLSEEGVLFALEPLRGNNIDTVDELRQIPKSEWEKLIGKQLGFKFGKKTRFTRALRSLHRRFGTGGGPGGSHGDDHHHYFISASPSPSPSQPGGMGDRIFMSDREQMALDQLNERLSHLQRVLDGLDSLAHMLASDRNGMEEKIAENGDGYRVRLEELKFEYVQACGSKYEEKSMALNGHVEHVNVMRARLIRTKEELTDLLDNVSLRDRGNAVSERVKRAVEESKRGLGGVIDMKMSFDFDVLADVGRGHGGGDAVQSVLTRKIAEMRDNIQTATRRHESILSSLKRDHDSVMVSMERQVEVLLKRREEVMADKQRVRGEMEARQFALSSRHESDLSGLRQEVRQQAEREREEREERRLREEEMKMVGPRLLSLSSCTHSDGMRVVSRDGSRWTATKRTSRGDFEYMCVSSSSCVGRGRGRVWKLTVTIKPERKLIAGFGVYLATVGEHRNDVYQESDVFGWVIGSPGYEWVSGTRRRITDVRGGVSMRSSFRKRGSTLMLKYDRGVDDRVTLSLKDVDPEDGWMNTIDLSEKGVGMDVLDQLVPCFSFVWNDQSVSVEVVHVGEF